MAAKLSLHPSLITSFQLSTTGLRLGTLDHHFRLQATIRSLSVCGFTSSLVGTTGAFWSLRADASATSSSFSLILTKKLDKLIFIGDFNLPGIDWNNWCSSNNNQLEIDFTNILRDFYLLQHVSCPTRTRGSDTPHILDLV